MSAAAIPLSGQVAQNNSNMVNGTRYTFVFQYIDLYANPSPGAMVSDVNSLSVVQGFQITQEGSSAYYNITFEYEGDGTDLISDVANAMIGAWLNDIGQFEFTLAFTGSLPSYNVNASTASSGIAYQFSPLNLIQPVTPTQQAAYQAAAVQQVNAVAASPGGQIATLQPNFNATVTDQSVAASNNVAGIASQANTAAALSNSTVLLIVLGIVGGIIYLFLKGSPKVSVGG